MRLLSKYVVAPALACLLAAPAFAQRSQPPTASQVTPSYRAAPLYRTPDAVRALDEDRNAVGLPDRMTNRLRTYSLDELGRMYRPDERARDFRSLEVNSVPESDWRLGLSAQRRLRLAEVTSRYSYERANIPTTGRLRKEDNLTGWRDYIGQTGVRVYNSLDDSLDIPPPGLTGPTPAPGGTSR